MLCPPVYIDVYIHVHALICLSFKIVGPCQTLHIDILIEHHVIWNCHNWCVELNHGWCGVWITWCIDRVRMHRHVKVSTQKGAFSQEWKCLLPHKMECFHMNGNVSTQKGVLHRKGNISTQTEAFPYELNVYYVPNGNPAMSIICYVHVFSVGSQFMQTIKWCS